MLGWGIIFTAFVYLLFLFAVASYGDRRRAFSDSLEQNDKSRQRVRSVIYSLSLAVYCTSWTFFGSVGFAATSGFNFLAIYLGPIVMVTLGFPLFRHIIAVAKAERITSIADFLASRYGKSTAVGAFAAVIAVLGTVPYIALQLKAVSNSVDIMINQYKPSLLGAVAPPVDTSFFVSLFLALFAILFGTRHSDATEHQNGLMLAVAMESIVKLIAFLAVGLFVTFYLFDGFGDLVTKAENSTFIDFSFFGQIEPFNFIVLSLLSFCAFVLLPRQFHVGVVENHSQREIYTARWLFPLYLFLINLFVVPLAMAGMLTLGSPIDADTYVLALPLYNQAWVISYLGFIGGLSAATAMVIVACVALAIMISNNLILPLFLHRYRQLDEGQPRRGRDMARVLLNIRRWAIFIILALAYGYFQIAGDSAALASIGLLSFAALAQFAPCFFLGFFWRRPTSLSALSAMGVGFLVWFYTLFMPTVLDDTASLLVLGPFGIEWLRPQSLFGVEANPLNHGVLFSLLANTLAFCVASFVREPKAIERMQAGTFAILGRPVHDVLAIEGRAITVGELKHTVANYLGPERCARSFAAFYHQRDEREDSSELADDDVIHLAEQLLASAIGAASSRLVMSLLLQKHNATGTTAFQLLGDASEALQYNRGMLQTALDQVEQGISVFDQDFQLSNWNKQFRKLLDLPIELGQVGVPLALLAQTIVRQLENSENENPLQQKEALIKQLLEMDGACYLHLNATDNMPGRIIEVQSKSLPDGGLVISWSDTTEKANAAKALLEANETLEQRVHQRTEELTRLNLDLAAAREEAEKANIGKTKFLAAVGHDILQPLNAARLYTSSLVEHLGDKNSSRLAENVDEALESVEDILGAVLAISRLDSGGLTPSVTVFSVERLFKKLDVEFRPIAENKGLCLLVKSNGFHVRSDYNLLRRLLQNLISNAIKYTAQGRVQLDARVKGNTLVFAVHDTGMGIEESDFHLIFQEFKRLEQGKKSASGLGLGLSIVQRLAMTLDHHIDFKTSVGKGSVFTVAVPLALGEEKPVEADLQQTPVLTDLSRCTVICLDNEPRILGGMQHLLEGWGCRVHIFESSKSLFEALPSLQANLVIADYHLDDENGLDVLAQIRKELGQDFPAILATADRSALVRSLAKEQDISLLNKPLKPAALRALLTGMLHNFNTSGT